mmetsp:Transcript_56681/g.127889  ORF Transcript_56681/g.127889 Transcript_56681/m.127889 type:complete len:208 (-) Transcript_56681:300-923(-)
MSPTPAAPTAACAARRRLRALLSLAIAGGAASTLAWGPAFGVARLLDRASPRAPLREPQESDATAAQLPEAASAAVDVAGGRPGALPGVTQNPPWATCFVEEQQADGSVLEEWVMRGEPRTLSAFRAWRRSSTARASVRCVKTPASDAMQTVCLQCASPEQGTPFGISASVRMGSAGAVLVVAGAPQCMAQAASGLGFCKSGQVTLR